MISTYGASVSAAAAAPTIAGLDRREATRQGGRRDHLREVRYLEGLRVAARST